MPDTATPRALYVEPTTRCNMRCSMCVKTVMQSPEGDLAFSTFSRLADALPHASKVVFSGVGEPLLHPRLADMVRFARQTAGEKTEIALQTNGLLLARQAALELVMAGLDTVCVSIDSLDPAQGEALHGAARLDALEEAMAAFLEAGKALGRPVRLGVEVVLMRSNLGALADIIGWAGRRGAGFAIVSHVFAYSQEADGQSLFNPNSPESQAYFLKWRDVALSEGIDFSDYYAVLWKVGKTRRQERLVELVSLMQKDANANGVWMNVKSLFDWQARDTEPLRQAYARARDEARRFGMELSLPPESALHQRRCAFMEDRSAFVSWTGDVSPCHFLWRSYRCRMDGEPKQVEAVRFGNLAQESMQAVWTKPAYREFRRQALGYDYPYCSSCNGGPCNYVTSLNAPFEEDCIGSNAPCCHCPWPVGQLACLG